MESLDIDLSDIEILEYNTIIIGSGAAGLNCALHLIGEGIAPWDIAIVTEKLRGGTSFNAGSDKQTYYKLSLIGDQLDSPFEMAKDLFSGGAMHGDIALVEANNSVGEFFHLIQLGVPFPHDIYGAYAGYKTDNDPKQRATSIGPYTSQVMSKCLLGVIKELKIKIFDNFYAVKILTQNNKSAELQEAVGVICIDKDGIKNLTGLNEIIKKVKIFKTKNIVMATGGPSTLYKNSVYPFSQNGTASLAIKAGCTFQNLTESQFGLASTRYRWNVSGSYQQVIPRYFSIDNDGNLYEFLDDYFPSFKELSKATFLKGYQWPFSSERIEDQGSSLIDLAVYYETEILKRKVFLDFRKNPKDYEFEKLDKLPKEYLQNSNTKGETPLKRLISLNEQAYHHYKDNGIDISKEPLQIAVCNQHLNGGVTCDIWWESTIKHLFAIGEINGSHGIHRPGGAALNSGQVGGLRAAQRIAHNYTGLLDLNNNMYFRLIEEQLIEFLYLLNTLVSLTKQKDTIDLNKPYSLNDFMKIIQERMEKFAGIVRPIDGLEQKLEKIQSELNEFNKFIYLENLNELILYFKVKDLLLTQYLFFSSLLDYHQHYGQSRGSFLISRKKLNPSINEHFIKLPNKLSSFNFIKSNLELKDQIQTIRLKNDKVEIKWEKVREIPKTHGWFETVWKDYNDGKVFQ